MVIFSESSGNKRAVVFLDATKIETTPASWDAPKMAPWARPGFQGLGQGLARGLHHGLGFWLNPRVQARVQGLVIGSRVVPVIGLFRPIRSRVS